MAYHKRVTHQISGNTSGVTANISTGTYVLAGGSNITLSQNANSVTIIGGAGGAGGIALANSQTTYTSGTAHLSGAGAITIASTTGQSYQFSVPNTSQISATGLLNISTNGNTISIGAASLGAYAVSNTTQSSSATVDGRSISFHGAGIASVGISNGSVVISANGLTSQSNQAFSGSNGSYTFQTATFGNLNGLSFYTSNGSMVGSYTTPSQTNQTIGIYASSNTTGQSSSSTYDARSITFRGAGVASVGHSAGEIIISVPSGGGAGDGVNILAAGTQTAATTGTVIFNDANGITFGMSNSSVITASHNGLTSQSNQALSGSNGSYTFQTATFGNLNGASFYTSNGSLVASYTVPSTAGLISNINVSGGTTSNNLSALTFNDANGVSFGLNGSVLTATVKTDYLTSQSNQALSGSNGSFTFQTATFGNLNGMSFYTSNGSVVGSYTVPTVTNSSWTVSDNATSGTVARLAFTNLNGVTLSLSSGANGSHTIVGSHNALTAQSNQALSGSNGSFTFQTATFGSLNGLHFYSSNGSLVGSYTVPTQTNQTGAIYAVGNTTGQSSSSTYDARTLSVDGAGIISAGWSNSTLRISATQSNQALSGSNGSFTFQTASFGTLNGISFYTSNGSLVASHNALTTARASNDAIGLNTAQSNVTWTVNSSGLSFDARGYAGTGTSATNASVTLNSNGLQISVAAPGGGVTPVASASNGSFSFTTLNFSNANNVTFGTSAGSIITASVAPPGAAAENNWMHALGANTAGNTTASGSTIGISGINLTISGTNNSVFNLSVPATSSLSATGAVSISTNGSTISIGAPPHFTASQFPINPLPGATSSAYSGATTTVAGGSQTTMSIYLSPFLIDEYVSFNKIIGNISYNTVAGTGSATVAQLWGLYTLTGGTFSSVSTWAFNVRFSQNSVTERSHYWYWGTNSTSNSFSNAGNNSASVTGSRPYILYEGGTSITPGNYWLGYAQTMRTSGAAIGSFSHMVYSASQTGYNSMFGTNVSSSLHQGMGIISTVVSSNASLAYILPASIHTSAITGTGGSSHRRSNFIEFFNFF